MAPSSDVALTIGEIEQKVNMSLDDIIKQSKGMDRKQHTKVKDWNRTRPTQPVRATQVQQAQVQQRVQQPYRRESLQQERVPPQRKDLLQKFVSLQSSALRQEKLKEARARHGTSMFAATKAAGLQALSGNAVGTLNRFSRKASQGIGRSVGTAARLSAARSPKVLIVNQSSMTGGSRRPNAPRIAPVGNGVAAQPQRQHWNPNKVMARNAGRKPQTLDSRFASLREERQLQSQFAWTK